MAAETSDLDTKPDETLLAATNHDLEALQKLLREPRLANVQDPDTGYTPLHAAISACEADDDLQEVPGANGAGDAVHKSALDEDAALATIKLLLENGAIWNDLDGNDETPGCIAHRLGLKKLYEAMVEAGIRAELLLSRLDGYNLLAGGDDGDDEDDAEDDDFIIGFEPSPEGQPPSSKPQTVSQSSQPAQVAAQSTNDTSLQEPLCGFEPWPNPSSEPQRAAAPSSVAPPAPAVNAQPNPPLDPPATDSSVPDLTSTLATGQTLETIEPALKNPNVNSKDYLVSDLVYSGDRLLDSDKNAVMMDWETEIMYKSVDKLVPQSGLRTMNVGFGMGIVDGAFTEKEPAMHHIIEAHPLVMTRMREKGWYDKANVTVHEGKWQDVLPKLVEQGVVLDAIYFDTYAEDYKDLKVFFQEFVIALLDSSGRFGFYNGLGADRQICYDVYTRIVEMDLYEAGLDTEWLDIQVPDLDKNGEWSGVRHKYWGKVNPYRLPTCTFVG